MNRRESHIKKYGYAVKVEGHGLTGMFASKEEAERWAEEHCPNKKWEVVPYRP